MLEELSHLQPQQLCSKMLILKNNYKILFSSRMCFYLTRVIMQGVFEAYNYYIRKQYLFHLEKFKFRAYLRHAYAVHHGAIFNLADSPHTGVSQ